MSTLDKTIEGLLGLNLKKCLLSGLGGPAGVPTPASVPDLLVWAGERKKHQEAEIISLEGVTGSALK